MENVLFVSCKIFLQLNSLSISVIHFLFRFLYHSKMASNTLAYVGGFLLIIGIILFVVEAIIKKKDSNKTTKTALLIGGGVCVGLGIILLIIWGFRKFNSKDTPVVIDTSMQMVYPQGVAPYPQGYPQGYSQYPQGYGY